MPDADIKDVASHSPDHHKTSSDASSHASPLQHSQPAQPNGPQRVEYYAEDSFSGANLLRTVHIGWGVSLGAAAILLSMLASAVTQSRSPNVSFRWLQRRVGFSFGTMSYGITTNLLFYYDGDKWVTRDWNQVFARYKRHTPPESRGFAASAVQ